jgi:hypothetical protein
MRKLMLDIEWLAESIEAVVQVRGAVLGHMPTVENLPPDGSAGNSHGAGRYPEYPCPVCGETLLASGDETYSCGLPPEETGTR